MFTNLKQQCNVTFSEEHEFDDFKNPETTELKKFKQSKLPLRGNSKNASAEISKYIEQCSLKYRSNFYVNIFKKSQNSKAFGYFYKNYRKVF